MTASGVLRVAAATLLAWAAGTTAVLVVGFSLADELPSRADVLGFIALTLIGVLLLAPLLYLPSLLWLNRATAGRAEPAVFALIAAALLNLPVVLLLVLGTARASFAAGEALMLWAIFAIAAGGFGWSVSRELRRG